MTPWQVKYNAFSMGDHQTASFVTPIISRLLYHDYSLPSIYAKSFQSFLIVTGRKKMKNSDERMCFQSDYSFGLFQAWRPCMRGVSSIAGCHLANWLPCAVTHRLLLHFCNP